MGYLILIAIVLAYYFLRKLLYKGIDKTIEVMSGAGSRKFDEEEARRFPTNLSSGDAMLSIAQYLANDMKKEENGEHDIDDVRINDRDMEVDLDRASFLLHFGEGEVIVQLTRSRVDRNRNIALNVRKKIDHFYSSISRVISV